ncbi:DUF349 domain-containing protein [Corynebacterium bovis]|nr:DUF349 domain-containing protein [Corynebacterium bovis]
MTTSSPDPSTDATDASPQDAPDVSTDAAPQDASGTQQTPAAQAPQETPAAQTPQQTATARDTPVPQQTPASSPAPRPGPTPGMMPGARRGTPAPAAARSDRTAAPRPVTVPSLTGGDPSRFGRVDDDGTVWLRGTDGDRRIGQWRAGTPEEGLAHFAQRFDDLVTEAALLDTRLASHPGEAARIRRDATSLRESLPTASVIGDLGALDTWLAGLADRATATEEEKARERAEHRTASTRRKEELAAEAERIGKDSTDWKPAGDRLKAIMEEWRTLTGVDRKTDDALWERFRAGRDAFNHRRREHFADLDRSRERSRVAKEKLVAEAEALQTSTDWAETSRAYHDLMTRWKAAGRAPRGVDDALWAKFTAAQDVFFAARKEDNRRRDEEFARNADAKQALLDEYDGRIDPAADLDRARALLHELQDRWDEIGFVPRDRVREFDDKLSALEARVSEEVDRRWRETDPETEARAAQLRTKVDQLLNAAADAERRGQADRAADLRAQAEQWRSWVDGATGAN